MSGWVIRADPIVSVADFIAGGGVKPEMTVALHLKSASDIEDLASAWSEGSAGTERATVQKMLSGLMAGVPECRTDTNSGFSYILGHPFHTNHNQPANMHTVVDKGMLFHKAIRDIDAGEELFLDYTTMNIEPFVKSWCEKNGLTDVETLAKIIEERPA